MVTVWPCAGIWHAPGRGRSVAGDTDRAVDPGCESQSADWAPDAGGKGKLVIGQGSARLRSAPPPPGADRQRFFILAIPGQRGDGYRRWYRASMKRDMLLLF